MIPIKPVNFEAKVWRQGNSLMVTIPSHIVKDFKIVAGDEIEVLMRILTKYEKENKGKFVKKTMLEDLEELRRGLR